MSLYQQHPELVAYLTESLRAGALHYILKQHEPSLQSWLDSIADDGSLEIPGRHSITRGPLLSDWPQYAVTERPP